MKKTKIRLTESELHKVIKESVKHILAEFYVPQYEIDDDGFWDDFSTDGLSEYAKYQIENLQDKYEDRRELRQEAENLIDDYEKAEEIAKQLASENVNFERLDFNEFLNWICEKYDCNERTADFVGSFCQYWEDEYPPQEESVIIVH